MPYHVILSDSDEDSVVGIYSTLEEAKQHLRDVGSTHHIAEALKLWIFPRMECMEAVMIRNMGILLTQ